MILNQGNSYNSKMYDLSFMYTKQCDLSCAFCMYSSGPDITDTIDLDQLKTWLQTVDMNKIASFGAYGGEVGIALEGFSACFDLVEAVDRPHFVITNGSWSTDKDRTKQFLEFCSKYHCHVLVSGTPWHRRYQNREVLKELADEQPDTMTLKSTEENFHAMGRLEGKMKFSCSQKCMSWNRALRIAVQPDGTIIFQNCDGIYPIVGNLNEAFPIINTRIEKIRQDGFASVCQYYK